MNRMNKINKYPFLAACLIVIFGSFSTGVQAQEKTEPIDNDITTQQSYQASISPSSQVLNKGTDVASWRFSWGHSPGPYGIYFSSDTGKPSTHLLTLPSGTTSMNHQFLYSGIRPKLHNPSIQVSNAYNDPAFASASVYREP